MIDVGLAGQLGYALAWMSAVLLLASFALTGRVMWALAVRGARRGVFVVTSGTFGVSVALALFVGHFVGTPQALEIAANGDWIVYDAYGLTVDTVPSSEVRQVRLTSPIEAKFSRVEVRHADGRSLVLHGEDLRITLGYAFERCGAWRDRPVWGPHAYDALGPRCSDPPWPAALSHADHHTREVASLPR